MRPKKEKSLITLLCTAGTGSVAYGMIKDNDPVFIVGLVLVIVGYLLIRRKLKEAVRKKP